MRCMAFGKAREVSGTWTPVGCFGVAKGASWDMSLEGP